MNIGSCWSDGGLYSLLVDGLGLAVATLAVFMAIDYISGLVQAFYNKDLKSKIGFRGLVRKVLFFITCRGMLHV